MVKNSSANLNTENEKYNIRNKASKFFAFFLLKSGNTNEMKSKGFRFSFSEKFRENS